MSDKWDEFVFFLKKHMTEEKKIKVEHDNEVVWAVLISKNQAVIYNIPFDGEWSLYDIVLVEGEGNLRKLVKILNKATNKVTVIYEKSEKNYKELTEYIEHNGGYIEPITEEIAMIAYPVELDFESILRCAPHIVDEEET